MDKLENTPKRNYERFRANKDYRQTKRPSHGNEMAFLFAFGEGGDSLSGFAQKCFCCGEQDLKLLRSHFAN
jgi:hypothetical protein